MIEPKPSNRREQKMAVSFVTHWSFPVFSGIGKRIKKSHKFNNQGMIWQLRQQLLTFGHNLWLKDLNKAKIWTLVFGQTRLDGKLILKAVGCSFISQHHVNETQEAEMHFSPVSLSNFTGGAVKERLFFYQRGGWKTTIRRQIKFKRRLNF